MSTVFSCYCLATPNNSKRRPSNKNICQYLLKNYRNIIIYCDSHKDGNKINNLLNKLQNNSSEYIDCDTPKKERNRIINDYKKGEIPFLVNVRPQ